MINDIVLLYTNDKQTEKEIKETRPFTTGSNNNEVSERFV